MICMRTLRYCELMCGGHINLYIPTSLHITIDTKIATGKQWLFYLTEVYIRLGSGGRIRTSDLRVMSPTSYQTALPRDL